VGYYKRPDLDAEVFTEDGFFRTGDLGELAPDGVLKLTGRAKELFKTAKGKYVAPAPIENRLNANPLVEMSMVSGVGKPSAYAIVVLAENLRPRQRDPAVRREVETELGALLKHVNGELADYEQVRMIVIAAEPWAIENGMLTPTMKIRRNRIEAAVEPELERWYEARGSVVWS
jgi:long-subunit acyl-CoA synthetase (AMP-forming)